jgi:hypothetical protein
VRGENVSNPIQAPELEAPELERMAAILRKRAEQAKVTLPQDVALYLAQNVRSSTRALEGTLLRLIAQASMTGTAITLTYTRHVLKHFMDAQTQQVLVDSFPRTPPEQSGTIEANIRCQDIRCQDRLASDQDLAFCLQTRDGRNNRRVRHELEVNMRESERERLARWDAYEWGLERRAKTRRNG